MPLFAQMRMPSALKIRSRLGVGGGEPSVGGGVMVMWLVVPSDSAWLRRRPSMACSTAFGSMVICACRAGRSGSLMMTRGSMSLPERKSVA